MGEVPLYSPDQNEPAGITAHTRRVCTKPAPFYVDITPVRECRKDDKREDVANEGGVDSRVDTGHGAGVDRGVRVHLQEPRLRREIVSVCVRERQSESECVSERVFV